jgi:tRNA(Ile)-lysidine synthase
MLQSFTAFISQQDLFKKNDRILLAVSGGIDSVVMCELFHQARISFGIAHCNFQLRDKESDGDEAFVKNLAKKYKVDFNVKKFNTIEKAEKSSISIQMAARELRFKWLEEIRKKNGYNYIAIAHHKDDSVETFFINLLRGTGIAGLHGILPKQGFIIRPLLFADRNEIDLFYKKNKLKHREDSSNKSDKYLRNKIRQRIIPELKKINPNISDIISEDINRIRDVEQIYLEEIQKKKKEIVKIKNEGVILYISALKKLNPLKTYLFEFLRDYNFTGSVIEKIIKAFGSQSGKKFYSSTHQLIKDREKLIVIPFQKNESVLKAIKIKKEEKEIIHPVRLKFSLQTKNKNFKISGKQNSGYFDYTKLQFPLTIRKWERGDVFYPIGMKGKKKLSDFFIDNKLSLSEKENKWLLISGNEIVWVIGMRIDERFKITGNTSKVYVCELIEE